MSYKILYHGTSQSNAIRIRREGFNASTSGMLGAGIYFAEEDKAQRFANSASERGLGSGSCVIKCRVYLGRVATPNQNDDSGSWRRCYDSAYAPYTRESSNPEWVVKCSSQITILEFKEGSYFPTRITDDFGFNRETISRQELRESVLALHTILSQRRVVQTPFGPVIAPGTPYTYHFGGNGGHGGIGWY